MTTYVALLAAVNVGRGRALPMAELRALVADAGGTNVETYIQSGNVVFDHRARSIDRLRVELESRLRDTAGFAVPVVLRTAAEIRQIAAHHPFPDAEPGQVHVLFFGVDADAGPLDSLDPAAFAPEELVVVGRQVYLHLPNGMGRSTLAPWLARRTGTATARNWRTVHKLAELTRDRYAAGAP
ncbi:MAG: DUF1697 domain-containing protein [Acidimicrobiales bacterium]|nr:DUF1697 domain-containing protein [Acidimicrobiales bacterium]